MHHIADHYHPAVNHVVEPHQDSGNQEEDGADGDGPEIKFLPSVEESSIFRSQSFLIGNVSLYFTHPPAVCAGPVHRREPVQELKEKEKVEEQAEPGMQKARHGATAKQCCEPAI